MFHYFRVKSQQNTVKPHNPLFDPILSFNKFKKFHVLLSCRENGMDCMLPKSSYGLLMSEKCSAALSYAPPLLLRHRWSLHRFNRALYLLCAYQDRTALMFALLWISRGSCILFSKSLKVHLYSWGLFKQVSFFFLHTLLVIAFEWAFICSLNWTRKLRSCTLKC